MKLETLYRLGGLILAAGALLGAATIVLELFVSPYNPYGSARTLDAPVHVVKYVSIVLLMFGLSWAYLRQSERAGILGLLGFLALFFGLPLTAMPHSVIEISLDPALSQEQATRAFKAAFDTTMYLGLMAFSGFLLVLLGTILTGIASLRARVLPRWAAVASLAGLVVGFGLGFLNGMFPGLVPHPPTFFLLGLGAYGLGLFVTAGGASAAESRDGATRQVVSSRVSVA